MRAGESLADSERDPCFKTGTTIDPCNHQEHQNYLLKFQTDASGTKLTSPDELRISPEILSAPIDLLCFSFVIFFLVSDFDFQNGFTFYVRINDQV